MPIYGYPMSNHASQQPSSALAAQPVKLPEPTGKGAAPSQIASEVLFNGAAEVQIVHNGAVYRLRQTALGKLILTK